MKKQPWLDEAQAIFPAYLQDLETLISYNSKCAPATEHAPLGEEIQKALECSVEIAKRLGFQTKIDPNGYYAYAEAGEGEELFGVLGHLDIVPADDVENWNTPPFTLTKSGDYLYGRGVADDKGPLLASMYALSLVLKQGYTLNKRVRFIMCTDEESLWRCVKAYLETEEQPTSGFTPDADFPLLYAEKGLVEYFLKTKEEKSPIMVGGTALNAVAGSAQTPYDDAIEKALIELGYAYTIENDSIIVKGKAAHSMAADEGINAITRLAQAMKKAGLASPMLNFMNDVALSAFAEDIFGQMEDEYSGKLTFNIGLADFKENEQSLGIDIRFPVSYKKEDIDKALQKVCATYHIEIEEFDYLRPVHISCDTPLVTSLMHAYQEISEDTTSQPLSTGGATFARSMDNIIAFGALLPGSLKTEHQANECASQKDLITAIAVYAKAFELLTTKECSHD